MSVNLGLGHFKELWKSNTSKKRLDRLSLLFLNDNHTKSLIRIIKIKLFDGKAIESAFVTNNFSVNGPGIMYLTLENDPILLANKVENITLHGEFQNGCLHGVVYGIAQWWKYPLETDESKEKDYIDENPLYKVLNFVGHYRFGNLIGPIWKPAYSLDAVPIGFYYTYIEPNLDNNEVRGRNQILDLRYITKSR